MDIFKYFDSLLSGKHSLLALKYSDRVEDILKKAYADACARKDKPSKHTCAFCWYPFAEKYLIPANGADVFHNSKTVCPRCLLMTEYILCEKCRMPIVYSGNIFVLHPIVYFSSAKTAKEIFPDRNIDSSRIALDKSEFEYLCGIIGKPEYARNFPHGSMICEDCYHNYSRGRGIFDGDIRVICDDTAITPELEKIGFHILFPDYHIIYN